MPRNIITDTLSHTRMKNDPLPHVEPAGIKSYNSTEHAGQCLNSTVTEQSHLARTAKETITDPTGLNFLPFSQQHKKQTGLRYIHGISNNKDTIDSIIENYSHQRQGIRSDDSEHAGDAFQQLPTSELQAYIQQQYESIYASNRQKPIGSSYIRGFQPIKDNEYSHGIESDSSESAKNLIYRDQHDPSRGSKDHTIRFQDRLKGDKDVTQPIDRQYKNTSIDIYTHRHGKTEWDDKKSLNSSDLVYAALHDSTVDPTRGSIVVNERSEIHRYKHSKPVGQCVLKNRTHIDENFIAGVRSYHDTQSAADCLKNRTANNIPSSDPTLGTSISAIQRLHPRSADTTYPPNHQITYGVPSIRWDQKPPTRRSLANTVTYGDEYDTTQLVFPYPAAMFNVWSEDFTIKRSRKEINDIFHAVGLHYTIDDPEFHQICDLAEQHYSVLSIDSFRHTYNQLKATSQASAAIVPSQPFTHTNKH